MLFFDTKVSPRDPRLLGPRTRGAVFHDHAVHLVARAPDIQLGLPSFGLVLLSHYGHGESARELGFPRRQFPGLLAIVSPALLFAAMLLLAAGILFQTLRDLDLERAILGFLSYCTWGLFQQYVLNAYFVNRLLAVSSSSTRRRCSQPRVSPACTRLTGSS